MACRLVLLASTTLLFLISFESPIYLLAIGRRQQAFSVLRKISKWNGCYKEFLDYIESKKINTKDVGKNLLKESQNISLADGLRKDTTLMINFILLLFIWSSISIGYFTNNYLI